MHTRLADGKLFYVGKGKDKRSSDKFGRNTYWNRIVKKDGGFTTLIYADNLTEEKAFELEKWLISVAGIHTLTNMTEGGTGGATMKGRKHSAQTIQKMSEVKKGKAFSKKHVDNLSAAQKGKTLSEDVKGKISKSLKGRKKTEEHKQRLSESSKKRPPVSETTREKMRLARQKYLQQKRTQTNL
jgi:hypothetical protein